MLLRARLAAAIPWTKPVVDAGSGLGLARTTQKSFAFNAGRSGLGPLAQTFCLFEQPLFEGAGLFETASHRRCSI
ncbi:hypothetical protein XH94_28580 [Bradyrhizobium zhanjiangense]|uniref:Uncharacterized protein n=1 Tax=Bradyrhizobium zhanjiangense TaxID=1325107 RepID=A0A4Q0SCI0_9BRAD|nr:hypothetical protein XH94_28580 [Bradyrhizobium zhanjiangense]